MNTPNKKAPLYDQTPEAWRINILTPAERLRQESLRAAYLAFVVGSYGLVLLPFLLLSTLYLDVPFRNFDLYFGPRTDLAISNWLSTGEIVMWLTIPVLVLMTRRRGEGVVGSAILLSWFVAAFVFAILLFYMLPILEEGDFPSARFLWGYFGSWFIGQYVAVQLYDVTRGGKWWRAPFYAAVFAFAVQSGIYYSVLYWGVKAPWLAWMVEGMFLKVLMAMIFLMIYAALRRAIRPWLGLSG